MSGNPSVVKETVSLESDKWSACILILMIGSPDELNFSLLLLFLYRYWYCYIALTKLKCGSNGLLVDTARL